MKRSVLERLTGFRPVEVRMMTESLAFLILGVLGPVLLMIIVSILVESLVR
jgi:hypothetical protein